MEYSCGIFYPTVKSIKEHWNLHSSTNIFRASVPQDMDWGMREPYFRDIAQTYKITNKRILFAFNNSECRDYFVESYKDLGACVENNKVNVLKKITINLSLNKEKTVELNFDQKNFDQIFLVIEQSYKQYKIYDKKERVVRKELEKFFLDQTREYIKDKNFEQAIGIIKLIPSECVVRAFLCETLLKAGLDLKS